MPDTPEDRGVTPAPESGEIVLVILDGPGGVKMIPVAPLSIVRLDPSQWSSVQVIRTVEGET